MLDASRDVFLSHRSTNKPFVRDLAAAIEAEHCQGRPLSVWIDEAEIRPGQSVTGVINSGLEKSRFVALIMTPEYFESPSGWTDAEWHAALYNDPDGRQARVIPILAADCVVPFLLRHLGTVDLRTGDAHEFARLLAVLRNEPLPRPVTVRGQLITTQRRVDRTTIIAERAVPQADPDVVPEKLYCNLLPAERLPKYLYSAEIRQALLRTRRDGSFALPAKTELKQAIRDAQRDAGLERPFMPAFRMFEDRLLTFHDLEDPENPLAAIIDDSTVETLDVQLFVKEEADRRLVTSLLNMALARHLRRAGLIADDSKHQRFFFPHNDGKERHVSWTPLKKRATRTVAKPVLNESGALQFWRHQGAYLQIQYLVNRFYVRISPTWVITTDGETPRGGPDIGRIVSRWTGPERNLQLLYHVRFWTSVLRNRRSGPIQITAGDQTVEVATVPAMIQQSYGIADDRKDLLRLLDEEAPVLAAEEDELVEEAALAAAEDGLEDDLGDVIDEFGEENGDGEELNEPPADER